MVICKLVIQMGFTKFSAFVIITGVVLLALIGNAFIQPSREFTSQVQADRGTSDESVVDIEVLGDEFHWHVRYPGQDGILGTKDDIAGSRELIVPVKRQIHLQLRSRDYIYVFAIPSLSIREIAVPDLQYSVEFVLQEPLDSPLPMDSLCAFGQNQNETMGVIRGDNAAWNRLMAQP